MVLNENLELMVMRYVDGWDAKTIVSIARELLAARKVVEAARKVTADGESDFNEIVRLLNDLQESLSAYDAATKGGA